VSGALKCKEQLSGSRLRSIASPIGCRAYRSEFYVHGRDATEYKTKLGMFANEKTVKFYLPEQIHFGLLATSQVKRITHHASVCIVLSRDDDLLAVSGTNLHAMRVPYF
jgi:hypothetical protein